MEVAHDTWLLKEAKILVETNIWKARNFLITAKSLCPHSLKLRLLEYKLELSEENLQSCSKLLKEMFDDFAGKSELWVEVIPLVQDVQKSKSSIQKAIFKSLPSKTQQKMIANCAEFNPSFMAQCQLYLLLIEQFPDTAATCGLSLAERLVQKEKETEDATACNQYRTLLIRQLLPMICKSKEIGVSNKQFYKWLQKSIEHYTCSYTSADSSSNNKRSWKELTRLRVMIGQQCAWKPAPKLTMTSRESVTHLRELYEEYCTNKDGKDGDSITRKQVFYSSIALLFENASKYMKTLDSAMYIDHASDTPAYIILPNAVKSPERVDGDIPRNSKLNEYFFVASDCLNLLNNDDIFEKDFSLLARRWKIDKWTWYQLFLANVAIYEEEYQLALGILSDLSQRLNDDSCTIQYRQRVYCHLAMVNFSFMSTENAQMGCDHACQFISMFSKRDISNEKQVYCSLKTNTSITQIYPLSLTCILPIFIDNFLLSMKDSPKYANGDDYALGHVLVLSQHDWPNRRHETRQVMKEICAKETFQLSKFIHHITNIEILEDLANIHNNQSCRFLIGEDRNVNTIQHCEQVISVLVDCTNRHYQPVNHIIVDYLSTNRELIVQSLSTEEMMID